MQTNQVLLPLLASLLMIGCGDKDNFRVSAPDRIEAGKSASVAVSGTFDGTAKISWTAVGGRIDGPNDGLTATLVAPNGGAVTVVCTIIRPGHKAVALDKQIEVTSAAASTGLPPVGDAAPPAAPGMPGARMEIEDAGFIPSGWMGDYEGLKVDPKSMDHPHSAPYCQKWSYSPRGAQGWAAVAWQFPENNWGEKPGKVLSGRGFHQVSVWARGVKDSVGVLPKVQFKAGGSTNPGKTYKASFEVQGDFIPLTEDWKQYTLDLRGQDLSQVVAGFVFVIRAQDVGPRGATFYLDDIEYQ